MISDFLVPYSYNDYSIGFGKELIATLIISEFESETEKIELINILIYSHTYNYFNINLDANFFTGIKDYSSINVTDPVTALNFARLFLHIVRLSSKKILDGLIRRFLDKHILILSIFY